MDGLYSRDEAVMSLVECMQWRTQSYGGLSDQHIQQSCTVAQAIRGEHSQRPITIRLREPYHPMRGKLALHSVLFNLVSTPLDVFDIIKGNQWPAL